MENKCELLRDAYKRYLSGLNRRVERINNIDHEGDGYIDIYRNIERVSAFGVEYFNTCIKKEYPTPLYRIIDSAEKMLKAKTAYNNLNIYKNTICNLCKNIENDITSQKKEYDRSIKEILKKIKEIEMLE